DRRHPHLGPMTEMALRAAGPQRMRLKAWSADGAARTLKLQPERYLGPVQDGLAVEECEYAGFHCRRLAVSDHDCGDDGVAVIVEGNGQCRLASLKWLGDRVGPAAALHPCDRDRMTGT